MFKLPDHRSMDIRGLKTHTLLQPSQLLLLLFCLFVWGGGGGEGERVALFCSFAG